MAHNNKNPEKFALTSTSITSILTVIERIEKDKKWLALRLVHTFAEFAQPRFSGAHSAYEHRMNAFCIHSGASLTHIRHDFSHHIHRSPLHWLRSCACLRSARAAFWCPASEYLAHHILVRRPLRRSRQLARLYWRRPTPNTIHCRSTRSPTMCRTP